ncbi:hypothetical protein Acsp02_71490 [Actinoplanes sp. NBRC 103695]|nr:hypothetical protein Acsp02_71490 [Actinoplanes sp. NBRC 103695]
MLSPVTMLSVTLLPGGRPRPGATPPIFFPSTVTSCPPGAAEAVDGANGASADGDAATGADTTDAEGDGPAADCGVADGGDDSQPPRPMIAVVRTRPARLMLTVT